MSLTKAKQRNSRKIDYVLIGVAIISFSLFVYRSWRGPASNESGTRIGNVEGGTVQRKKSGEVVFSDLSPGDSLYHLDALWTGGQQSSKIQIEPRTLLTLHPNTFLIVRRPSTANTSSVELVKGKVEVRQAPSAFRREQVQIEINNERMGLDTKKDLNVKIDTADEPSIDITTAQPLANTNTKLQTQKEPAKPNIQDSERKFFPANSTVFQLKHAKARISFSWGEMVSGKLIIRNSTAAIVEQAITGKTFLTVELANNQDYLWEIVGENNQKLFGPFKFRIMPPARIDIKKALNALRNDEPHADEQSIMINID